MNYLKIWRKTKYNRKLKNPETKIQKKKKFIII